MSFGGAQSMYAKMLAAKAAKAAAEAGGSSAAEPEKPKELALEVQKVKPPQRGALVLFGSTNHAEMGKKMGSMLANSGDDDTPTLMSPHRLVAGLGGARIVFVATSGSSAHCVALGADGEAFAWGRNESGQLGLGDLELRAKPTRVTALAGTHISSAATGKAHTLYLGQAGELLACGACKHGACGPNVPKKAEHAPTPVPVAHQSFTVVAAGQNFNLAIDTDGDVWSWGWSEHGVLGNGTDHQFNAKEGSVKLTYEAMPTPARVSKLSGQKCVHVACGHAHCAAVAGDGVCYTWGNGGYGRLGHKDQADLHTPKPLEECRARQVSCGSAHTAILGWPVMRNGIVATGAPGLFMCGRVKSASQNAWMYPKPEDELRGWTVHAFDVGASHNVVHADEALIAWGSGCANGELGLGADRKSSANPAKLDALDGVAVAQVACGIASTYLLVEASPKVEALPAFVPAGAAEEEVDDEPPAAAKGKGKAAGKRPAEQEGGKGGKGGKAKKGKS